MKRKVIKQANQAYTITLPIEWVRANNLTKESEVDIEISEKTLIIRNQGETEYKTAKKDVSGLHEMNIARIIKALYSKGIDEIELTSDKDITPAIMRSINNTIGLALTCAKDKKYIIKDISGTNYSNLDEIFKRVYQMILNFYASSIEDIFSKEKETLSSLNDRDREINKFCYYLQRAINKMSYEDVIKGRALFTYSFNLETIGDEIHRLWRTDIQYKIKKTPEIKKLAIKSLEGLEKAFEFYYQFNPIKAEEIKKLRDKVREDALKLKTNDKYTSRFIRHIIKIIESAADLSHLTLMIRLE
jgi:phosphate uptake regulator